MILQETVTSETVVVAILLAGLAGLSTVVGALIVFVYRKPSARFLALGLGFSGGVMLIVSFAELIPTAISLFVSEGFSDSDAFFWVYFWFFLGIFVILLVDFSIPHLYKEENVSIRHTTERSREFSELGFDPTSIRKMGILVTLGIAVHNFPEGIVTFTGTMESIELGMILAIAVALHNIPEGVSVCLPVYMGTNDAWYAFRLCLLSGLAEPLGAIAAAVILLPILSPTVIGAAFGFVAGIMVFISFDELLPAAKNVDQSHIISLGIIGGMVIVITTLWALG